ncbi:hypothetical protein V6N11_056705 [Hibiscus sabdariffa]|uniref:Uncharacterized protein n=1 Tax=Hibiscus sabdariffa TaxID=183260 RepID=A0ABR2T4N9_9ROSI
MGHFASNNIRERLDRSVATVEWSDLFPNFQNRRYEEQEELHTLAIHYFSNLFSSSNPSGMDAILNDVPVCISNHMNATLLRDFSSDEVAHAMASGGLRYSEDRFWVEDAPDRVRRLAAEDKRLLVPP